MEERKVEDETLSDLLRHEGQRRSNEADEYGEEERRSDSRMSVTIDTHSSRRRMSPSTPPRKRLPEQHEAAGGEITGGRISESKPIAKDKAQEQN